MTPQEFQNLSPQEQIDLWASLTEAEQKAIRAIQKKQQDVDKEAESKQIAANRNTTAGPSAITSTVTQNKSIAVPLLLAMILVVLIADLYFRIENRIEERRSAEKAEEIRLKLVDAVLAESAVIETNRMDIFYNYIKDLDSYETKSVYHQIYHATNAQLKMQNLAVQEHQLLLQVLAGKK